MRRVRANVAPTAVTTAALVPNLSVAEPRVRLGDVLVQSGVVTREAVETAAHAESPGRIGTVLIERGIVDEYGVTRALSEQLHVPVVDLRDAKPEDAATALVDAADAHRLDVLPLVFADGALTVAVADPLNHDVMELLRSLPVGEVRLALGVPSLLRTRVNRTYSALSAVTSDIEAFQATDVAVEPTAAIDAVVDAHARIVQVVNKIVTQALRDRASDVHIEPAESCVRVRFRVDGALHEVVELPSEMGDALVSRIKIMADMNIVERRRPQDGIGDRGRGNAAFPTAVQNRHASLAGGHAA